MSILASDNDRGYHALIQDSDSHSAFKNYIPDSRTLSRWRPDSKTLLRIVIGSAVVIALVGILRGTSAAQHVREYLPQTAHSCKAAIELECGNCLARGDPSRFGTPDRPAPPSDKTTGGNPTDADWKFDWRRDGLKYGLSSEQCMSAFPGIYKDTELALERRRGKPVTLEDMDEDMKEEGAMRAMIYEGQLLIIETNNVNAGFFFHRALATFQSLYRAIIALPDPTVLPNIEFTMTIHDSTHLIYDEPNRPIWSYARLAEDDKVWLMPDFGYWSWPEGQIGTPWQVAKEIEAVERKLPMKEKVPKVFWRGNVETAPELRGALVEMARDKPWADVHPILWQDPENLKKYLTPIQDHCKWMFLAHTEGHSYSGRLKYMQHCQSVIIAHEMEWLQPQNYMMVSEGPDQNFVQVDRNFTQLEAAVTALLKDPAEARRIADNQIKTFKERYLTPAAEACYWRNLIESWAKVSPEPVLLKHDNVTDKPVWRGTPFENYAMMKEVHWS